MTGVQIAFLCGLSFLCGWALHKRVVDKVWDVLGKVLEDGPLVTDAVIEHVKSSMTIEDWRTVVRVLMVYRTGQPSEKK